MGQSLLLSPWAFIDGVVIESHIKRRREYSCLELWSYPIPCRFITTLKNSVHLASSGVELRLLEG